MPKGVESLQQLFSVPKWNYNSGYATPLIRLRRHGDFHFLPRQAGLGLLLWILMERLSWVSAGFGLPTLAQAGQQGGSLITRKCIYPQNRSCWASLPLRSVTSPVSQLCQNLTSIRSLWCKIQFPWAFIHNHVKVTKKGISLTILKKFMTGSLLHSREAHERSDLLCNISLSVYQRWACHEFPFRLWSPPTHLCRWQRPHQKCFHI